MLQNKMGTKRRLARGSRLVIYFALISLICPFQAWPAQYGPLNFFISADSGWDAISPSDLNATGRGVTTLSGFITGRVKVERGIKTGWGFAHWLEASYQYSDAAANDGVNTVAMQAIYWSGTAGVTWWFIRSSYVDVGAGIGLGVGFLPTYRLAITPAATKVTTITPYSGGVGFVGDARVQARFWFTRWVGLDGQVGFRYYSPMLTSPSAGSLSANFMSLQAIVGFTLAIGGAKGVGRKYVEVIPADVNPQPLPTPTATVTAKPVMK
ncbi:MAG: hypothetical protein ACXWP5_02305 [Bdellovibrionota bacterium]